MGEKTFAIENTLRPDGGDHEIKREYKAKLLNIINDIEKKVRVVNPDEALHNELHERRFLDARRERAEFEPIRRDVCESFGVPYEPDHLYFFNGGSESEAKEQRALRAFFVLIDTVRKEAFFGEGRIDHNTLFQNLVRLLSKIDPDVSIESIVATMDSEPPKYLVFKGFMSLKDFAEISNSSRRVLETPIIDSEGKVIETADEWFITGHNLAEPLSPKHSS